MKEGQLHKTSGTGVIDAFLLDSGKGTVATFTFLVLSSRKNENSKSNDENIKSLSGVSACYVVRSSARTCVMLL